MATTPSAGALDQRITLQQRTTGVDALGQEATSWADVATVWARAMPLRGRDFFAAAQAQATLDVRFTLRYRADVAATWRVVWRGTPFDIVGQPINVDGCNVWLELMCVQGVRDGR